MCQLASPAYGADKTHAGILNIGSKKPNQSMKPNGPIAKSLHRVCHDTLPWLISFSLGLMTPLDEDSIIATRMLDGIKPDGQKTRIVQAAIIGEPPNRTDDAMERAMDGRFAAARKFSTSFGSISAGAVGRFKIEPPRN
jgi:hypothetical protein